MNYELLIGLRYTRAQPREGASNRFISFIALISMLGLALGVATERAGGLQAGHERYGGDAQSDQHLDQGEATRVLHQLRPITVDTCSTRR